MTDENIPESLIIPEQQLLEMYQILYKENLFGLLSEDNYNLGKDLLKKEYCMDLGELRTLGLRFTLEEHMNIVSNVLDIREKTTDFWKIVVRIIYIITAIERNPFAAADIEEIKNVVRG